MKDNPLNVVSSDEKKSGWVSSKTNYRQEAKAKYERLWHIDPKQFDPTRNCMEQERLKRTVGFIKDHLDLNGKKAADLGCGRGELTRMIRDLGASVDAIDIASNAFDSSDNSHIDFSIDYVPRTKLPDDHYDLVIAADIIAYLDRDEYRLFMAELSRIVKPSGIVFCSTPLDINSEDALIRFHSLSETEFQIEDWKIGYHRYWIRLKDFFQAPGRFATAYRDRDYRSRKLEEREGFSRFWFRINSAAPLVFPWLAIKWISNPIATYITKSRSLLLGLEKVCRTLSPRRGISHVMWVGKRRPLIEETRPEDQPKERKGKKQVWE